MMRNHMYTGVYMVDSKANMSKKKVIDTNSHVYLEKNKKHHYRLFTMVHNHHHHDAIIIIT